MALVMPVIGFAETGRERWLHSFCIKVGCITKGGHAELGDALSPLFCNEGCNGCR